MRQREQVVEIELAQGVFAIAGIRRRPRWSAAAVSAQAAAASRRHRRPTAAACDRRCTREVPRTVSYSAGRSPCRRPILGRANVGPVLHFARAYLQIVSRSSRADVARFATWAAARAASAWRRERAASSARRREAARGSRRCGASAAISLDAVRKCLAVVYVLPSGQHFVRFSRRFLRRRSQPLVECRLVAPAR